MNYSKVHAELDQRVLAFYFHPKGKREKKNQGCLVGKCGHGLPSTAHQRLTMSAFTGISIWSPFGATCLGCKLTRLQDCISRGVSFYN